VFGLEKVDRWNPIRTSVIQSRSGPMRFLGFSNHEKGAPRQEISKLSPVCSTFSRSGWSVVRNASLAKGSTLKIDRHRTSTKFRLGVIRRVHELFKRPFYVHRNMFKKSRTFNVYSVPSLRPCCSVWVRNIIRRIKGRT
jgi:hypothetical protein